MSYNYLKEDLAALKRIRRVYGETWEDLIREGVSTDNVEVLVTFRVLDSLVEEYTNLVKEECNN